VLWTVRVNHGVFIYMLSPIELDALVVLIITGKTLTTNVTGKI
jgi:hypothetical protein